MGNASIFAGSDVKILKDNLNFNGKSKIISVNGNPSSGSGVAATAGTIGVDYTTGKLYRKIDSVNAWAWSELGGTNTSINYYANPDTGPIGWTSYNDGAAAPVDGSGGSSTGITFNRSTAGLLRGTSEILLDKNALNNSLGSGRAYDFTIDKADVGKTLEISFDFSTSVGYADGNLTVWIIQDPTGTPVVIQPTTYKIPKIATDTASRFVGTFQTQGGSSAIRNYRLCLHVSTSSIALWDATIDNIRIGPQTFVYGAPVTDWVDFPSVAAGTLITATTTNPTYGTVAYNRAQWRRVGSDMEIRWDYRHTTAGTAGSGTYLFNLPSGFSIDTSKVSVGSAADDSKSLGVFDYNDPSGNAVGIGYATAYSATQLKFVMQAQGASGSIGTLGSTYGQLTNSTLQYSLKAKVPILGWSSSVQMSNDTDTRVVAAVLQKNAAQSVATNTAVKVTFPSIVRDTHGAWDATNSRYIVPVSGFYDIRALFSFAVAVSQNRLLLYKNGSLLRYLTQMDGTSVYTSWGSACEFFNAGDYVEVFVFQASGATQNSSAGTDSTYFSINRLSGPSQIAASETVAARYQVAAGVSSNSTTPVNFATRVFDSHGAVTTGASWRFSAPIAGKYSISTVGFLASGTSNFDLYKNGAFHITLHNLNATGATSGTALIEMIAGDYMDIRTNSAVTTGSVGTAVYISIHRIGN